MSRACPDDCYYYYNSTCNRGESCVYRHCEAAKQTQEVCPSWRERRCFNQLCAKRHSEASTQKDRSKIACYWENQAGGCRRPQCPFLHLKPRNDHGTVLSEEEMLARVTSQPPDMYMPLAGEDEAAVAKLYMSPPLLPQETNASVDSPKVEPVVINPFEEESDGDSVQGTPVKSGVNPRIRELKVPLGGPRAARDKPAEALASNRGKANDKPQTVNLGGVVASEQISDLNFGVKSLEEIRQAKLERAKELLEEADRLLSLKQQLSPEKEEASGAVKAAPDANKAVRKVKKVIKLDKKTALKVRDALQSSSSQKVTLRPIQGQGQIKKKPSTPPVSEERIKLQQAESSQSSPEEKTTLSPSVKTDTGKARPQPALVRTRRKSSVSPKKREKAKPEVPQKKIVKVSAKAPSTEKGEEDVGVKSLEEIWREKALASLRKAQEKKRLEAEKEKSKSSDNPRVRQEYRQHDRETGRQPGRQADRQPDRQANREQGRQADREQGRQADSEQGRQADREQDSQTDREQDRREVESARRVVVRKEEDSAPRHTKKAAVKSRLGTRHVEEKLDSRNVQEKKSIKDRLGLSSAVDKHPSDVTSKLRVGSRRDLQTDTLSRQRAVPSRQDSDEESDVSLRSDDSLLQSDNDSADSGGEDEVTQVKVKDLEQLRRERTPALGVALSPDSIFPQKLLADLSENVDLSDCKEKKGQQKPQIEFEEEIEAPKMKSLGIKRKVNRSESDDAELSPPKMRKSDLELKKKKPLRKVTIQNDDNTTEDSAPPSKKISPITFSAKSRLGSTKVRAALDRGVGLTRTLKIRRGVAEEPKADPLDTADRNADTDSGAENVSVAKRKIKPSVENKGGKREPRIQIYRPPGAQKQSESTREASRQSTPSCEEIEEKKAPVSLTRKPVKSATQGEFKKVKLPSNASGPSEKDWAGVKTFAEILREKQLRKQQGNEMRNSPVESNDDGSGDGDSLMAENTERNLKRPVSPAELGGGDAQTATKLVKHSPVVFDKPKAWRGPDESTRKIRRNVWSTRGDLSASGVTESSTVRSSQNTRKLNLARTVANTGTASDQTFKTAVSKNIQNKPSSDLFGVKTTKRPDQDKPFGSVAKSDSKTKSLTGRSPLLRNKEVDLALTVPVKPASVTSQPETAVKKAVVQNDAAELFPLTPLTVKSQPKFGKSVARSEEELCVQIPKSAVYETKDSQVMPPAVSPSLKSPKAVPQGASKNKGGLPAERRASVTSSVKSDKAENADDLFEDELLELAEGETSMEIGSVPDDDELLMEMKELLA